MTLSVSWPRDRIATIPAPKEQDFGHCPRPVTVYNRGHNKGYIAAIYIYKHGINITYIVSNYCRGGTVQSFSKHYMYWTSGGNDIYTFLFLHWI